MSAQFGCKSGPAKLLRHSNDLKDTNQGDPVSQELRRSGFAPKLSRHSAVGSTQSAHPRSTKPRSQEIALRSIEIAGSYFCLHRRALLVQEISTLPGIAVNGSNGAKQCRAVHTCSNSQVSHSAHPPHTACSQTYLRTIRELQDGKAKYPRPNFHPRLRF